MSDPNIKLRFSIDRGGTFTDIFCEVINEHGEVIRTRVMKLLSEDPENYNDAPTEGIRRLLEQETKIPHNRADKVMTKYIDSIRMGTTVATNALLERKGEPVCLFITKGFNDLLVINNQSRPKIFDLKIHRPEKLFQMVIEVDERVILLRSEDEVVEDEIFFKDIPNPETLSDEEIKNLCYTSTGRRFPVSRVVTGKSQERVFIEKKINQKELTSKLGYVKACGINSIAVAFVHSYTFTDHEDTIVNIAKNEIGFDQVSASSDVMPMIKMIPRGNTAVVDAYLTPVIKKYLASFRKGFENNLDGIKVNFMQSDGGLVMMDKFCGNKAILSGPAGGVVGYAVTSKQARDDAVERISSPNKDKSVISKNQVDIDVKGIDGVAFIGFDMGGTSTDVSRFDGHQFEHVYETVTAGVTIQSPQLDINTVAAGGGSRLFYRNNLFEVGPESAGAFPGPVCYRHNGYLAITDANLLLGRVQPHLFPAIFGPTEDQPLDLEATRAGFNKLTEEINTIIKKNNPESKCYTPDEVAYGFICVATEAMARPIRNLTTMKGFDVTTHWLTCFGGAGPQHCCAIAKSLGMKKILVHKYAGILSAYGLSLADVVVEKQEPFSSSSIKDNIRHLAAKIRELRKQAIDDLVSEGFQKDVNITLKCFLNCRYQGSDTAMMTSLPDDYVGFSAFLPEDENASEEDYESLYQAYKTIFINNYRREFGFELQGREILVDDIRVRATGHTKSKSPELSIENKGTSERSDTILPPPAPREVLEVYFENGRVPTAVYNVLDLPPFTSIPGPAIIMQDVATVVVEPNCTCYISKDGNIEITIDEEESKVEDNSIDNKSLNIPVRNRKLLQTYKTSDPVYLSIFGHRFMSIAEQMGRTLQRTSISVNIKERLDFSCALFDKNGGLVANAPHLPVHLGAMSEAVKYQIKYWGENLHPGDVLVSNHPQLAGGSHLPDITVITPIFWQGKVVYYVASRGHHADVGGIAPGSMPPLSKTLEEEGAAIVAFKLVEKGGEFNEAGITELLMSPGKLPGNSGTRNISDNLNDLKAQIAANQRGALLMHDLILEYSLEVVDAYMTHIQECAESSVRNMLYEFSLKEGLKEIDEVTSIDYMDDGTPIKLKIQINRLTKSAIFDFTGTGPEIYGNLNAPPAITSSAIIYCLRCLLPDSEIPLNQGCLKPIEIIIPKNTILNPSPKSAVVGGNVTTSQRITDIILKAFKACADSQGCMNNLTFGNQKMGYYETIAGGAGAGPSWHGTSGVHTHMTNTRITDVEILEKRYPVVLREFNIRKNSGGIGKFNGGDGVVRKIQFNIPLTVSILSERRSFAPSGILGGSNGERGLNLLTIKNRDDLTINLGGKNTVNVAPGDILTILTPGGGGFGKKDSDISKCPFHQSKLINEKETRSEKELMKDFLDSLGDDASDLGDISKCPMMHMSEYYEMFQERLKKN